MSRLVSSFIISYCVISTASYIFPREQSAKSAQPGPEARSRVEGLSKGSRSPQNVPSKALPGSESQQDEISLPLVLYVRQRRGAPYLPGDPEWKSFTQLQEDEKLLHDIKLEVARQAEKEARRRAQLTRFLQVIQPDQMLVNLELVVPLNRPPVYEVPYLVVKPGVEAALVWRRLPDSFGSKLDRMFHPIILSKAFYQGLKEFWVVSYRITKARAQDRLNPTGLSSAGTNNSSSQRNLNPLHLARPRNKPRTEEEKADDKLPIRRLSEQEMKKALPFLRGEYGEQASIQGYRDAVRTMTYRGAIESACTVFRQHWALGQAKAAVTDVRDPCHIIGYVEIVGERGKLRLDVFAVYSPKAKSLVGPPMITKVYGIPNATKWYEPSDWRKALKAPGFKPQEPQQPHPPQSTEVAATPTEDKEPREVDPREGRGGEK